MTAPMTISKLVKSTRVNSTPTKPRKRSGIKIANRFRLKEDNNSINSNSDNRHPMIRA